MTQLLGGLLIGLSLGLLGSGGSILTVPVLAYGLGHAERVAIAESLLIVGAIALVGAIPYLRARRICWKSVTLFGIPGMGGTYLGAALSPMFPGTVQLLVFGGVMLAAAGMMLRRAGKEAERKPRADASWTLIAVEGLAVGALTGFVGVGGGFLIVPALVFLRGLSIRYAVGTSLVIIALKSAVGFVKYLDVLRVEQLSVSWMTIAVLTALGAIGTGIGARLNGRLNPVVLGRVFAVFLAFMAAIIIFQEGSALFAASSHDPTEQARVLEVRR